MSKRNLQTAADAGALAAAQALHPVPRHLRQTCVSNCRRRSPRRTPRQTSTASSTARPTCPRLPRRSSTSGCDPAAQGAGASSTASRARPRPSSVRWPAATRPSRSTVGAEATVDVATRGRRGSPAAGPVLARQLPRRLRPDVQFVQFDYPQNGVSPPAQDAPAKTESRATGGRSTAPRSATGSTNRGSTRSSTVATNPCRVVPGQADTPTPGELTVTLRGRVRLRRPAGSETCLER